MSQEYSVPGSDSGDPRNPNQQNEAFEPKEPLEPLEPPASGYTGAQFIAPDDQHPGETGSEEQSAPSSSTSEAELPLEAQGEVNGGPLGCCLGVTIGIVLSLTLAVFGRLYLANPLVPILHDPLLVLILLRIAMGILGLVAAILFGSLGWKLGKRFFREYEPPVVPVRPSRQKQRRRKARSRPREA
jgi:hypothetical protein